MNKEALAGNWLETGRFVDGEKTFLGRRRETVQEAILAFAATGMDFPENPDSRNQDHYFVAKTVEVFAHELDGTDIQRDPKTKLPVRAQAPLAWWIGDLAEAIGRYTNYNKKTGAGRRYDEDFSFLIKILKPEWPCITSRCGLRGSFKAPPNTSAYFYRKEIHGLSPWEKALKKEEIEFFRRCGEMKHVKIREKLGRLFFLDPELSVIHHLEYHDPYIEALALDPKAREALVDAWNDFDDRYDRREPSYFDLLLDHSYSELAHAVTENVMERRVWEQADDLLQRALQNQPYDQSHALPIFRKMKFCNGLLELLKAYWDGTRKERLKELGQEIWVKVR